MLPVLLGPDLPMDVRTRLEHLVRVKRKGFMRKVAALAAGPPHPYNPDMSWEWVLTQVVSGESDWWRKELEEYRIQVATKAATTAQFLEDDAVIEGQTGRSQGSNKAPLRLTRIAAHRSGSAAAVVAAPCSHTRVTEVCSPLRRLPKQVVHGNCKFDSNKAHQCTKCLATSWSGLARRLRRLHGQRGTQQF